MDGDGINGPDGNDTIYISGCTVNITSSVSAPYVQIAPSSNALASILNISNAGSLTTTGDFFADNRFTSSNTINVLGNVTIGGSLQLKPGTSSAGTRGAITFNIGDNTNSPTVQVTGDLDMRRTNTASIRTAINLYYGSLDIDRDIIGSGTNAACQINILDDAPYSGLTKRINFGGVATTTSMQKVSMNITDSDNEADFIFTYDGTGDQTFLNYQSNWTYMQAVIQNTGFITRILNNLDSVNTIHGNIFVANNVTLSDSIRIVNLNDNTIIMQAGSIFKVAANAATYDANSFSFDQASTVLFSIASGTMNILTSAGSYPIVELEGAGIKRILAANTIDGITTSVGSIHLKAGTFNTATGVNLDFSGIGQTQTLTLDAGTTWSITGTLGSEPPISSFDLTSTISYASGASTLNSFHNATDIEPFGNLTITGSGVKTIANADTIKVRGTVDFTSSGDITFSAGGYLWLVSTASYTGNISAMATGNVITYGTGQVVCEKFITVPEQNYRDFTSPVKSSTLENFEPTLGITGLVNCIAPSADPSVYKYVESLTSPVDTGWVAGLNTNESTTDFTGPSGSKYTVTRSGWRFYSGDSSPLNITLLDSGQIFRDTVKFQLSYTSSGTASEDGWHLMGNPYPSNMSWDVVVSENPSTIINGMVTSGVYPTMYVYCPSDQGNNSDESLNYTYWNPITLDGDPTVSFTGVLVPFQGFWLQTFAPSTTSFDLKLSETAKTTASGVFYKSNKIKSETTTIIVSDGTTSDRIGFHTFENATLGHEKALDINKFRAGSTYSTSSLKVDFALNNEPMNLRINSIQDNDDSFVLPLYLKSVGMGTSQSITFDKLDELRGRFNCISLHDKLTDTWIDLTQENTYNYTVNSDFSGVRFELHAENSVSAQAKVYDATCFDKEDGLLRVTFNTNEYREYDLFEGSTKIRSFEGNYNSIKTSLGHGAYILKNRSEIPGCDAAYSFTVGSMPLISFEVTPSVPAIIAGKELQLNNTTTGASGFLWTFNDDNSTSSEISPKHTFLNPGNVVVVLDAISSNSECNTSKAYNYNVQQTDGVIELTQDEISATLVNGSIQIENKLAQAYDMALYTIDGRLIESRERIKTNSSITAPAVRGTYILTLISNGKARSQKFVL